MEKVQLIVLGLSASPAASNAYALILKEVEGERRLPIIIGAFEAQAIALEMEGVMPPRPMTHDLIKNLIEQFGANLSEVMINDLVDGTFYAKLIFDDLGIEIDSRPSDAIAIAVRCNAPIYVNPTILDETAILPSADDLKDSESEYEAIDDEDEFMKATKEENVIKKQPETKAEQLQAMLEKAIKDEDYEKAAQIRDEINKLREN